MTVAMHTIQVPLVKAYNIGLQKKRMLTKRTCASKPKRNKKHHYMYINVQKWKNTNTPFNALTVMFTVEMHIVHKCLITTLLICPVFICC